MDELDEVIGEFLVESTENLDRLDGDFVELERDPSSRAILGSIFRTIHTIKGTSGFLGFSSLEAVTHVGENLLSLLRDGALTLTPEMTTALLQMVDAVREMLGEIEATGTDGDKDYTSIRAELARLATREPAPAPAAVVAAQAGEGVASAAAAPAAETPLAPVASVASVAAPARAATPGAPDHDDDHGDRRLGAADSSIRVDVGLLDKLMNLVGELVLARNQILQHTTAMSDTSFLGATQRLNLITTELQEGVMKTRMQPIGNVWSKFPRVVRDLALQCGKKVRIEMEGKDTELDKTIIEAIKDPLTHLVRNSVDHGIELPEARRERGKPEEGTLLLRAYHEGGQVNIEIIDDGAGIDPERIRRKAVEKGLLTADQAARLYEHELVAMIFQPGFSTAEQVSNISGRGVGMDVVKTNIEKIGGTLDIQSRVGEGTTLKIKIPLTLAIIPALVVSTAGDRYAIPQVSLLELVRLEGEQVRQIEMIGGAPVYRLRGRLLPIVFLREALGLERVDPTRLLETITADADGTASVNIVVLQADGQQFGLVVDRITDTEEIVVKPLGRHIKHISVFAGTTIMGDGSVALILDVLGIAQQSGVLAEGRRASTLAGASGEVAERRTDVQTLLVCSVGDQRVAIPLAMVARLEEFPRDTVERAAGREVVQYRGQLLPLLFLAGHVDGGQASTMWSADPLQVLVYTVDGRSIGLVVDQILDIVEEEITVKGASHQPTVEYSGVIGRRVTDLLDVTALLQAADPSLFATSVWG